MFKKILVPLDGSKSSTSTLKMAIEIANHFQSQITLLNVGSLSTVLPLNQYKRLQQVTPEEITRFINLTREVGFRILEQGRQLVEASGVPVKTMFKEGHPAFEIIRIAQEGGYNLIILGEKGVSHVKEIQLGSTTDQIVRNAPCTVLVCKLPNARSSMSAK